MGSHPWGRGSWSKGEVLTDGEISWERRGASDTVRGGWNGQSVPDKTEWDLHRLSMPHSSVPQTGMCVHWCTQGLRAGTWVLESKPRERTAVGGEETAWGDRREEICNLECLWRKHKHHCWVTLRGWSHHCSLSLPMCQPPALPGTRQSPHQGWPSQTYLQALRKAPTRLTFLCLPPGTRKKPHQGWPSPACCQWLRKAPTRAVSLAAMAASFPAHLSPPGAPWPRQLCHLHALSSLGQTQVLQGSLGSRLLWVAHTQRWG